MHSVGIDLHRSRSHVAVIGEEGDVLLSRRNVGDPATFLELLAEIDGECRIALRSRAGSRRSLSLAFTGAASAQTAFQANTTSTGTLSAGPGSNGAVVCGTAKIAHFGAASWDLFSAGSPVIDPQNPFCAIYPQTADFTLLRDQKSTLTLDENDTVCGPGLNGAE